MDEYAAAKRLLFDKLKPNGLAILNKDDEAYKKFITNNTVLYGFQEADYQITDASYEHTGTTFNVNNDQAFNSKLLGEYNVYNLLTAIIILEKMGYSYIQETPHQCGGAHRAKRNQLVVENRLFHHPRCRFYALLTRGLQQLPCFQY